MSTSVSPVSGAYEAFSFGDPEPVLSGTMLADLWETTWTGQWYEPPVSFLALSRLLDASPHHASCIRLKVRLLSGLFKGHPLLTRKDFRGIALDYLTFGTAAVETIHNRLGDVIGIRRSPALWTRVGREGQAFMLQGGQVHSFLPGRVALITEPDVRQEIYGLPTYLAGVQSILLNENATLFRRRYFENGSHAGYIMYLTDAQHAPDDIAQLRKALKDAKGPGNFRNLFLYAPGGKADGLKIIPIAEAMAKDEFLNVKGVSRDDILAVHRVPPQLLGIVPSNAGGFGDIAKASETFINNEIWPLMEDFASINDLVGGDVIPQWKG